jgi:hypothetical protein
VVSKFTLPELIQNLNVSENLNQKKKKDEEEQEEEVKEKQLRRRIRKHEENAKKFRLE